MDLPALIFALLALLLTPGPTNTLMAIAGAERGLAGAARLVPAEIAAYLAVTLPLALGGEAAMQGLPAARPMVAIAAALWVAVLAVRLWQLPEIQPDRPVVSPSRVFVTTLLNPKGLVIGLVLLPGPELSLRAGVLVALIAAVALTWAGLGAVLTGGAAGGPAALPLTLRRFAAAWLGLLSLGLAATGIGT